MNKQPLDKEIESTPFIQYQTDDEQSNKDIVSFQDALTYMINTQIYIPSNTGKIQLATIQYGTFIGKELEYTNNDTRVQLQKVINGITDKVTDQNLLANQIKIQRKFSFSSPDALMHNMLLEMQSKYYNGKVYFINSIRASVLASMLQESRLLIKNDQNVYKQFLSRYGINELWQACKISATQILGNTPEAQKIDKLQKQIVVSSDTDQNNSQNEDDILMTYKENQCLLKFEKQDIAFGQFDIQQNQNNISMELNKQIQNIQVQQKLNQPFYNIQYAFIQQKQGSQGQQDTNYSSKYQVLQNYKTIKYHDFLQRSLIQLQQQINVESMFQQYNQQIPQILQSSLAFCQKQSTIGQIIQYLSLDYFKQSYKQYTPEQIKQFSPTMAENNILRPLFFNMLISMYNNLDSIVIPLIQQKEQIETDINKILFQCVLGLDNLLYNKLYVQKQMNLIDGIPSFYIPFACTSQFSQILLQQFNEINQQFIINELNKNYFNDSLLMLQGTCYFNLSNNDAPKQKNWFKFDQKTQMIPQQISSRDQIIAGCNFWPTFQQMEQIRSQDILQYHNENKHDAVQFTTTKTNPKWVKRNEAQSLQQYILQLSSHIQSSKVGFILGKNQQFQVIKQKDSDDYVLQIQQQNKNQEYITTSRFITTNITSQCFDRNQYQLMTLFCNKQKVQLIIPQTLVHGVKQLQDLVDISERHTDCFQYIINGGEITPALVFNKQNNSYQYFSAMPEQIQYQNLAEIGNYMQYCLNQYLSKAILSQQQIYDLTKSIHFSFIQFFKENQLAQRQMLILKDDFDNIEIFIGNYINQQLQQGQYESLMRQICKVDNTVQFKIGLQNLDGSQIETKIQTNANIQQQCQQFQKNIFQFLEQNQDQIYKDIQNIKNKQAVINKCDLFNDDIPYIYDNNSVNQQHIKQIDYGKIRQYYLKQTEDKYIISLEDFANSLQVLENIIDFNDLSSVKIENKILLSRIEILQNIDQLTKEQITICDICEFRGKDTLKELIQSGETFRFTTNILKQALINDQSLPLYSIITPAILAGQQPLKDIFGQVIQEKLDIYNFVDKQQYQQLYVQPPIPTEPPPQPQAASEDVTSQQLVDFWIQLRNKYYNIDNYTIQALRSPLFCLEGKCISQEENKIALKQQKGKMKNSIFNLAPYQKQIYNINPYWIPQCTTYELERLQYFVFLNEQIARLIVKPIKIIISKTSQPEIERLLYYEIIQLLIKQNYQMENKPISEKLYYQLTANVQDVDQYKNIISFQQQEGIKAERKALIQLFSELSKFNLEQQDKMIQLNNQQKSVLNAFVEQIQQQNQIFDLKFYGLYEEEKYPAPIEIVQFLMTQQDFPFDDQQQINDLLNRHKLLIQELNQMCLQGNIEKIEQIEKKLNQNAKEEDYQELVYSKLVREQNKLKVLEQENMEINQEIAIQLEALKNQDIKDDRDELFNTAAIALYASYKQKQKPIYSGKIATDQLALGAYETVEEDLNDREQAKKFEQVFKDFDKLYQYADQNNVEYGNPTIEKFKNGTTLSSDDIICWK